jgi:hypothetical protein
LLRTRTSLPARSAASRAVRAGPNGLVICPKLLAMGASAALKREMEEHLQRLRAQVASKAGAREGRAAAAGLDRLEAPAPPPAEAHEVQADRTLKYTNGDAYQVQRGAAPRWGSPRRWGGSAHVPVLMIMLHARGAPWGPWPAGPPASQEAARPLTGCPAACRVTSWGCSAMATAR